MCLAIPGKLVEKDETGGLLMGVVAYGEVRNRACLEYVPEAEIGDFVMVHAGFAISVVDRDEARIRLAAWRDYVRAASAAGMEIAEQDKVLDALEGEGDG